jgi:uncharacterized membrane protein
MMDSARLEAFSDGVFAVAITLLALNLAVPGPGHGALLHQLARQWPAYVAYVVSFFVIGVLWVNHHSLFRQVARVDRGLLYANLCLLLFVVVIPFITSTFADYLRSGGQDGRVAAVLYAVVMEAMGLSFTLMFAYVVRAGLLAVPLTPAASRAAIVRFGLGAGAYLVAIVVAFVWPPLVLAIAGVITGYYIVERVPTEPAPQPEVGSGERPAAGGATT